MYFNLCTSSNYGAFTLKSTGHLRLPDKDGKLPSVSNEVEIYKTIFGFD